MKFQKIFLSFFLVTNIAIAKQTSSKFEISHSNDINIFGKTSGANTGDDLLTGTLDISYNHKNSEIYQLDLKSYTTRHSHSPKRLDTINISYLQNIFKDNHNNIYLGISASTAGNFAGEAIQKMVHIITNNKIYNIAYAKNSHSTLGIIAKLQTKYNLDSFILNNELSLNINIDESGEYKNTTKITKAYKYLFFYTGFGMTYVDGFKHKVVQDSIVDNFTKYIFVGIGFNISSKSSIDIKTSIYGADMYRQDDYSTAIRFIKKF